MSYLRFVGQFFLGVALVFSVFIVGIVIGQWAGFVPYWNH